MLVSRIDYLLNQFLYKKCTESEKSELFLTIANCKDNELILRALDKIWQRYECDEKMPDDTALRILKNVFEEGTK